MEKNKQARQEKKLFLIGIVFFIWAFLPIVQAEMAMTYLTSVDVNRSVVESILYLTFDDTSSSGIGANKLIPVNVHYQVQPLPYSLYSGQVDWCNISYHAIINEYNDAGELTGTIEQSTSYYFNSNPYSTGREAFIMANRDMIIAIATCHYTNSSELFIDNILFGSTFVLAPSYECKGCEDSTLEGLSNEIEELEVSVQKEETIHATILNIVSLNFQVWAVLVWIVKILLIMVSLGLIFYSAYWIYKFLRDLAIKVNAQ
jgi:hypothetical protein